MHKALKMNEPNKSYIKGLEMTECQCQFPEGLCGGRHFFLSLSDVGVILDFVKPHPLSTRPILLVYQAVRFVLF